MDFLNGFHDAANSIATIVSTRVLKPQWAVLWAAFFNFVAFLFFGLHVAKTIGTGLVDPSVITVTMILAALCGAIFWNIITWFFGLPSSSSHALIGGLLGAGIAKAGIKSLMWPGIIKVVAAIVISPLLGYCIGLLLMFLTARFFFNFTPHKIDWIFRKLQFISSAFISLGHGGNDAQKTMGMKITKLKPVGGFCAETSSAITLFLATALGVPVSTTHTITGAIVGVGSLHSVNAVRWGVARNIVWAWILTIPASGLVAAGIGYLLKI